MNEKKAACYSVFTILLLFCFASCSSVPKQPPEVFTVRNVARTQLEQANQEADRGNYSLALVQALEARRLAVSVDDTPLRVRTGLSMGNCLFFLGRREEAEAAWRAALDEAETWGDAELAAISRIYLERGKLLALLARPDGDAAGNTDEAGITEIRSRVQTELGAVKADRLSIALGWIVMGLAEKELGRYKEAEDALKKALAFHEDERHLEQAAYDWYLMASVFSVSGRYDAAIAALNEALKFDRRAENVYGLGKDWLAAGDVYTKADRQAQAAAAYQRAAEIFRSGGFMTDAER
jgi:tetratricopeptide (TPR) repeat protein